VEGRKLLVSHMEYVGRDIRRDLEIISSDVVTREKWWPLTNACQEVLKGTPEGSRWKPMEQIMHLP
jgi:L-rhamnose mutarotase